MTINHTARHRTNDRSSSSPIPILSTSLTINDTPLFDLTKTQALRLPRSPPLAPGRSPLHSRAFRVKCNPLSSRSIATPLPFSVHARILLITSGLPSSTCNCTSASSHGAGVCYCVVYTSHPRGCIRSSGVMGNCFSTSSGKTPRRRALASYTSSEWWAGNRNATATHRRWR